MADITLWDETFTLEIDTLITWLEEQKKNGDTHLAFDCNYFPRDETVDHIEMNSFNLGVKDGKLLWE